MSSSKSVTANLQDGLRIRRNFGCASKKTNDETSEIFYNTTPLKFPDLKSLQDFLQAVHSDSTRKVKHIQVMHAPPEYCNLWDNFWRPFHERGGAHDDNE